MAVQVVALLIGAVLLGQVMTLVIVMLMAPPRPPIYRLSEIASALEGSNARPKDGRPLTRDFKASPPAETAVGRRAWIDLADRAVLAAMIGAPADHVRLVSDHRRHLLWEEPLLGAPNGPPRPPPGDHRSPDPAPPQSAAPGLADDRRGPMDSGGDRNPLIFEDFKAALLAPDGRWVVVAPTPDPFPLVWQARIAAWLLVCLTVLAPTGYLFSRRFVAPISAFAKAAEQLGRDPRASVIELHGPAEIGAAAQAFNDMQARLKRYVEDRTSMIAAISHDLRTPLTRIRFKLESAPEALRGSVASDIDQMEAMISGALAFVRDATQAHERETLDLLSVLECVVDDARSGGGDVSLEGGRPQVIDGDALALQRLFANLIDNAVKYGGGAQVRLFAEAGEAVVEVRDEGPGLPASELEQVFEPFYRTEPSRNRDTGGIGLGLAVARSVARAHGGDVTLRSAASGLIAAVRLPLATTMG